MYADVSAGARGGQQRVQIPGAGVTGDGELAVWMLGTRLMSSVRAECSLCLLDMLSPIFVIVPIPWVY